MRAATTHPPAKRTQKAAAPQSQKITTHGKNGAECTLDTVARIAAGKGKMVVLAILLVEAAGGALRMPWAASGMASDGRIDTQVTGGAAIMATNAAQASRYRVFGLALPAITLRTAA
jgi:hypothetical protein